MASININNVVTRRLNTIEATVTDLHQKIDTGFEKLLSLFQSKQKQASPQFDHQYFLLPESDSPEYRLAGNAQAETMIDGIIQRNLNYEDMDSQISQLLKDFTDINACRYHFFLSLSRVL